MAVYVNGQAVGVTKELPKPDMLQTRIDSTNSCNYLFYYYGGTNIDFADNIDTSNVTSMRSMYEESTSLTKINTKNLKTSNVTNMQNMFASCSRLSTLDISNFDMSNVTTAQYMFRSCSGLKSFDMTGVKPPKSKVIAMGMFQTCYGLTSLNLGEFGVNGLGSMQSLFSGCSQLSTIDISKFNTRGTTDMYSLFSSCGKLENIIVGDDFDTSSISNAGYMFSGCSAIATIPTLDLIKVTGTSSMFNNCKNLMNLTLKNIKANIKVFSSRDCTPLVLFKS